MDHQWGIMSPLRRETRRNQQDRITSASIFYSIWYYLEYNLSIHGSSMRDYITPKTRNKKKQTITMITASILYSIWYYLDNVQPRLERPSAAIQITDTVDVFARRELSQRVSLQEESVRRGHSYWLSPSKSDI